MKSTNDDVKMGMLTHAVQKFLKANPELHAKYQRRTTDRKRTLEEIKQLIEWHELRVHELKAVLAEKEE